jgi:hypothetical protein
MTDPSEGTVTGDQGFGASEGHSGQLAIDRSRSLSGAGQLGLKQPRGPGNPPVKTHGLVRCQQLLDPAVFDLLPDGSGGPPPPLEQGGGRQTRPLDLPIQLGREVDRVRLSVHPVDQEFRVEEHARRRPAGGVAGPLPPPSEAPWNCRAKGSRQIPKVAFAPSVEGRRP